MIDKDTLKNAIEAILLLCKTAHKFRYGTPEYKEASKNFWNVVKDLDDLSRVEQIYIHKLCCLAPGRFVKFPVKDGYARYIILKVGGKTCKLLHLPWAAGSVSSQVVNDEAPSKLIENILVFEDDVADLLKCRARMPQPLPVVEIED